MKVSPLKHLLLFDLNGTLVSKKRRNHTFDITIRPYVPEFLNQLHASKLFTMGVFSSATTPTVTTILHQIRAVTSFSFEIVLDRKATVIRPPPREKPWNTVKPLAKIGDLKRIILVEDSIEKAAKGEHDNFLIVPSWEGNREDVAFKGLAPHFIDSLGTTPDVRLKIRQVSMLAFQSK